MKFNYTDWKQGLAQIGQQLNTTFALATKQADGSYTNNMPFVKCRDFFGDVLHAVQTNETQGIYGFKFDPAVQKLDTDKCRLLIQFQTPESYQAFQKNYNHFKKELRALTSNIGYGKMHLLDDGKTILIVANPIWQQTVVNISWFTFVHKCLSYPNLDLTKSFVDNMQNHEFEVEDWQNNKIMRATNERDYFNKAYPNILTYLKNIKTLSNNNQFVHGYNEVVGISTVHNSSGFVAVCKNFFSDIGAKLKVLCDAQPITG